MKKKYVEPVMVVEDFTVSEMIAADCQLKPSEVLVVQQMSHTGCDSGQEDKYFSGTDFWGSPQPNGKGTAYQWFSNNYEGIDFDGDHSTEPEESMFTASYREKVPNSTATCAYDPMEHGVTFGYGYTCNDDVSALQKS